MSRILCTWELGSDLGHLSHLRLPIEQALELGHEVFLAARELRHVREVLGGLPVRCLQAPFKQDVVTADRSAFPSYTHMIVRQCFSGVDELEGYVRAWRAIFDLVQPDLVLFEHSPTALIAACGYVFKKIVVGNGFFVPPLPQASTDPFAPFVTTARTTEVLDGLRSDDQVLLQVINGALQRVGTDGFDTVHEVYGQADERFLMTLPALDHFGERPGERYLGVQPTRPLNEALWPEGDGQKVFGYLHPMPSLESLLSDLQAAGVCALLYVRDLPPELRERYSSVQMRFIDERVDLGSVAAKAAWVINHGNHNTVASFVLTGLPQLLIPRHQEHLFTTLRLVEQGCALMAYQDQAGYASEFAAMQTTPGLHERAVALRQQCPSRETLDGTGFVRQTIQSLLGEKFVQPVPPSGDGLRLDLGCGTRKKEGFLGVDAHAFDGVDVVLDLRDAVWPWQDGSVHEVHARHFLEHLTGRQRIGFFNELYRVMAVGATALIITPHWSHECAYGDPTHEWPPVTNWTYNYLNRAWREVQAPHVGYECDFDFELKFSHDPNDALVASSDDQSKSRLMTRNINTATELLAELTKRV